MFLHISHFLRYTRFSLQFSMKSGYFGSQLKPQCFCVHHGEVLSDMGQQMTVVSFLNVK